METPKTAENILRSKYGISREHGEYRHFFDPIPDMSIILKAMEAYGNQCAEQARREAVNSLHIEIHNKIVETRVELYKATQIEIVDRKLYDLDIFIGQKADAAAGYGKEEK